MVGRKFLKATSTVESEAGAPRRFTTDIRHYHPLNQNSQAIFTFMHHRKMEVKLIKKIVTLVSSYPFFLLYSKGCREKSPIREISNATSGSYYITLLNKTTKKLFCIKEI